MTNTIPIATMPAGDSAAEARSVLDMQGLDSLKAASAQTPNDPKTLRAVAQQFESLFIGMMLKSMRDAKLGDGLFDSDQSRFYQDMFDQQLSVSMSQGKGLGIADLLVRSLAPQGVPPALPAGAYGRAPRRPGSPRGRSRRVRRRARTGTSGSPSARRRSSSRARPGWCRPWRTGSAG